MDTIRAIEDRRAQLQAEMERLDKQQRELEAMRPEAKFAIALPLPMEPHRRLWLAL